MCSILREMGKERDVAKKSQKPVLYCRLLTLVFF